MNTKHINRNVCLTGLALRRALTWEFAVNVILLLGTAASVAVTSLAAALTFRLL